MTLQTPLGTRTEYPIGKDVWEISNGSVINYALSEDTRRYKVMEDPNPALAGTIHVNIQGKCRGEILWKFLHLLGYRK